LNFQFLLILKILLFSFLSWFLLGAQSLHSSPTSIKVNESIGSTYLLEKSKIKKAPVQLKAGSDFVLQKPVALITKDNSFLEVTLSSDGGHRVMRLGRSTAIEVRSEKNIFLFQGSFLVSDQNEKELYIQSKSLSTKLRSSGTWLSEVTPIGIKLIVLEGKVHIQKPNDWHSYSAGKLLLVSDKETNISKPMSIELPLLLRTSKLLNSFSSTLPTHSRLISAAKVQSQRTGKKYNALLGDLTANRKLRIWSEPETQSTSSTK